MTHSLMIAPAATACQGAAWHLPGVPSTTGLAGLVTADRPGCCPASAGVLAPPAFWWAAHWHVSPQCAKTTCMDDSAERPGGVIDVFLADDNMILPEWVMVTDVRMPPSYHREGIDAAKEVRKRHPGTGVVVLSQYDDPEYAVSLLAAGSAGYGYLLKDRIAEGDQLADAIRAVATGGTALDRSEEHTSELQSLR